MAVSYKRRNILRGIAIGGGLATMQTSAGCAMHANGDLLDLWDYIIVGAGSAGCVLANRLSANPDNRVLLLEAGKKVSDAEVSFPPAWPSLAGGAYDWNYQSTNQSGLDDRSVAQPRGKGLGGSTLINAMGFQRGPAQAYDAWAQQTGDHGWSFASLLPYFKKLETASSGPSKYRGGDGPLNVLELGGADDLTPLGQAIAEAGIAAGHTLNPDWNGERADGTIWSQLSVKAGQRHTAAAAYLDPVEHRPNLTILTEAVVSKLRIEAGRCASVEVKISGRPRVFTANREVILSAGAFDSPRLLLLSGIGDKNRLEAAGVPVVHHLPGVGQNLTDHPLAPGLLFRSDKAIPVSRYNHAESMVVAQSRQSPGWADLMIMGLSVPFVSPVFGVPPPNSFAFVPALTFPRSRGSLTISSPNMNVPAAIDPGYLEDDRDVQAMVDGFEIARDIANAEPMKEWIAEELFPGPDVTSRKALADHVRRVASPFFHPVSTCAMGLTNDELAVLDSSCNVRGIEGLRVVDASSFPSIPQAMTNAAVVVLAERASDIIIENATRSGKYDKI